jgi:hypothetical protein
MWWPRKLAGLLGVGFVASAGCGHERLEPASGARLASDTSDAVVAVDAGVRVVASLNDWRGAPTALPDEVTPIKIRVVNRGNRPVSILYENFALEGRGGRRYRVIPAIPLAHATLLAGMGPIEPLYATSNFEVAARYHDIYPSLDPWPAPLSREDRTSKETDVRWKGQAPGREVCRMELPEGVLAPEGEITGYLYFEDPTRRESLLTLDADLVSANGRDTVASIKIPLLVK